MTVFEKTATADPLRETAIHTPESDAVITPECTYSYAELEHHVAGTARRLRSMNLHYIGICLNNEWATIITILAAIRAGAVACLMSVRYPPQGVATLLQSVDARLIITRRTDLANTVEAAITLPEDIIDTDNGPAISAEWDSPATVVFTSGSTGAAKAAVHSMANHYYSAAGANMNMPLVSGDRWLLALPLYHVGGLGILFRSILAGATVVIPHHKKTLGQSIRRTDATHISLVATQLRRLLEECSVPHKTLKAVLAGGGFIPESLVQHAHALGYPLHTTYGLTEMTSQVTTTPPHATLEQLLSSGYSLPHRQLRIAAHGEILVKGAVLFQGYLQEGRICRTVDADGWFHSGDIGVLCPDGSLCLRGRMDNMLISGGENIHCEELEKALCMLPAVDCAIVVSVPDRTFGQRPVAFVRRVDESCSWNDLVRHLEQVLPRFKIPRLLTWPDNMPDADMPAVRSFFRRLAEEQV